MTAEEAIERLKKRVCCEKPVQHFCRDNCLHGIEECEIALAIEALEKQISKEVTDVHCDEYFCPSCGSENNCDQYFVGDKYCPNCGQRLDWSEEYDD